MNRKDLALIGVGAALASRRTERVYERTETHEHRAPTDESVRLLKEMQEKAEAKVLSALTIEGNGFNCVIHSMLDGMQWKTVVRAVFDLNGKRMTAEASADADGDQDSRAQLLLDLRDKIATKIANEVLENALRGVQGKLFS